MLCLFLLPFLSSLLFFTSILCLSSPFSLSSLSLCASAAAAAAASTACQPSFLLTCETETRHESESEALKECGREKRREKVCVCACLLCLHVCLRVRVNDCCLCTVPAFSLLLPSPLSSSPRQLVIRVSFRVIEAHSLALSAAAALVSRRVCRSLSLASLSSLSVAHTSLVDRDESLSLSLSLCLSRFESERQTHTWREEVRLSPLLPLLSYRPTSHTHTQTDRQTQVHTQESARSGRHTHRRVCTAQTRE